MPRFFKTDFKLHSFLDGADAGHVARSLRMRPGENLTVCDGEGTDYDCVLVTVSPERVELEIRDTHPAETEPDVAVTLCTCLLKGDKLDDVVRHAVELGAVRFLPVLSQNCVSRPDEKGLKNKVTRWQKIAAEAAGQCGRGRIPQVLPARSLRSLCDAFAEFDLVLFFYEAGGQPLGELFWDNDGAKSVAVITGPEGGFTPEEAEMLSAAGAKTVTLGKRILRAETAPLAALTSIMLLSDNLE